MTSRLEGTGIQHQLASAHHYAYASHFHDIDTPGF